MRPRQRPVDATTDRRRPQRPVSPGPRRRRARRSTACRPVGADRRLERLAGQAVARRADEVHARPLPDRRFHRPGRHGASLQGGALGARTDGGHQGPAPRQVHARGRRQFRPRNPGPGEARSSQARPRAGRGPRRQRLLPRHRVRARHRPPQAGPPRRSLEHGAGRQHHLPSGRGPPARPRSRRRPPRRQAGQRPGHPGRRGEVVRSRPGRTHGQGHGRRPPPRQDRRHGRLHLARPHRRAEQSDPRLGHLLARLHALLRGDGQGAVSGRDHVGQGPGPLRTAPLGSPPAESPAHRRVRRRAGRE